MATNDTPFTPDQTLADVVTLLGDVPITRIRAVPPPGTATEQDVSTAELRTGHICELIDGTLVEKTVGYFESLLAMLLGHQLLEFVQARDLGIVLGEAGPLRLEAGQVRIPDVCFIRWERFPDRRLPSSAILPFAPDLAIEILSEGNTAEEMNRKLRDYFRAGVRAVWYLDPRQRAMRVYSSPDEVRVFTELDVVDGGDVLPGFQVSLAQLFARAEGRNSTV